MAHRWGDKPTHGPSVRVNPQGPVASEPSTDVAIRDVAAGDGTTLRSMSQELNAILQRQEGMVRRSQALQEMSLDRMRHLLGRSWQIVLPGVYASFTGTVSERQRLLAALLYAGGGARLADVTALARYGVRYLPRGQQIHVLIPAAVKRANRDGVLVRRTHRMPPARQLDGLPYCPPERALVELCARICDRRTATAVIADAVQRQIAVPERLALELPHLTGRGAGDARAAVLAVIELGARSAPEADFLGMCAGYPELCAPLVNPLLELPDGRRVSPDSLFLDAAVVHETNGRGPHAEEDAFESMQVRHDALTAAGFIVLHNTPRSMSRDADRVMREVLACVTRYAGRGLPPGVTMLREGPPGSLWLPAGIVRTDGPSVGL
jgi:hypothetical protein